MLPNFLIVGAAKCGTTSLYKYLEKHPNIFLSNPKEPKYLTSNLLDNHFTGKGDDVVESNIIKSLDEYKKLFSKAEDEIAIGEASADTLYYYKNTIPRIKETCGDDTKIIIILRNPIDRAFSAYTHLRRDFRETLSFTDALLIEDKRIEENYEFLWHYKKVGLYYKQVKAFKENFSNVKVILLDEIKKDSNKVIKDVLNFLNVNSDIKLENDKVYNPSGIPKNNLYKRLHENKSFIKQVVKVLFPQKMINDAMTKLKFSNLRSVKIDDKNKKELLNYYIEDVNKLSKLINKDLYCWLN